jgi:hypothetical protein
VRPPLHRNIAIIKPDVFNEVALLAEPGPAQQRQGGRILCVRDCRHAMMFVASSLMWYAVCPHTQRGRAEASATLAESQLFSERWRSCLK